MVAEGHLPIKYLLYLNEEGVIALMSGCKMNIKRVVYFLT